MLSKCAASCDLCRLVCQDHDENCGSWARHGECSSNESFMKKACPASCGVCQSLEANRLRKLKEEL